MRECGEAVRGLVKSRVISHAARGLRPRENRAAPLPLTRSRIPPATQATLCLNRVLPITRSSTTTAIFINSHLRQVTEDRHIHHRLLKENN